MTTSLVILLSLIADFWYQFLPFSLPNWGLGEGEGLSRASVNFGTNFCHSGYQIGGVERPIPC